MISGMPAGSGPEGHRRQQGDNGKEDIQTGTDDSGGRTRSCVTRSEAIEIFVDDSEGRWF
jgi:hypothetical protein